MQKLSIESFLNNWIDFTLYYYGGVPSGIPSRAKTIDAEEVLPFEVLELFASRPAFASDLFRYKLLSIEDTVWVDLDVICLTPNFPTSGMIVGMESDRYLNNAVLSFGSKKDFAKRVFTHSLKTANAAGDGWAQLPWGTLGPKMVTDFWSSGEFGDSVMAQTSFYAVPPSEFWHFWVPWRNRAVQRKTRLSYSVHLWNELYSRLDFDASRYHPHPKSFIGQLCKIHGVHISDNSISGALLEVRALKKTLAVLTKYLQEVRRRICSRS